jgi:predicted metal-dependent phosphoesterase TrpH
VSSGTTLAVDLHVHSEGSYDGRAPIETLLEQARAIGLDAIVVTDHDAIDQSLKAASLAPAYGLIGIPGVEVSTAHGHLLAIGVEELPTPREPLGETISQIRALGGVAVVPHPFQRSRHGIGKRRLRRCEAEPDTIEVYNPWLFTGYENRRAKRFARRRAYPGVAGSDAHVGRMVGRAYTEIAVGTANRRGTVSAAEVAAALGDGTGTAIHGRRQPIHRSARHYLLGATRKTGRALRHTVAAVR